MTIYYNNVILFIFVADVNVDNPDKKCIMMYIMCLFQALPHSNSKQQQQIDKKKSYSPSTTTTTTTTTDVTSTKSSSSAITVVKDLNESCVGTTGKTQNDVTDPCTAEVSGVLTSPNYQMLFKTIKNDYNFSVINENIICYY